MNKEFEKFPEVKKRLISVKFNEALNRYESKNPALIECLEVALFLNGAWYAYQEQQKKIDAVLKTMDEKCNKFCESHDMDSVALLEEIEGLLK